MDFAGPGYPLTSQGLANAATRLGIKGAELWAVFAVETSGCGFLADRRPRILYERHIFSHLTEGRFDDGDISDPRAGGYGADGASQYERLSRAIALDRTAALQSTSWGLGQILGGNFRECGFSDVETMVASMVRSEDEQAFAFARFLKANRLDRHLQAHDWVSFARRYNGPTFVQNHYDTRLRVEYQKYAAGGLPDLELRAAQLYLTFLNFSPGAVDGLSGKLTTSAISEFQQKFGLPHTGILDPASFQRIEAEAVAA